MSQIPTGTVVFEDVSKRYRLGALGTLRSTLASLTSRSSDSPRDFWALKDVSFRVEPGESLGLIGPNGAGKTTTLKLLSNITQPTSGRVEVSGRLSSLIELGAGFHPELSGRDNIFLNGAILGLKRREIQRKLDAIIAFSELERFIDTPVKRYSSGMYVRLGFAVAAHVEPEALLIDEVLAVGDASFRQKCLQRMRELQASGTTIVFVSHNMYQVQQVCARVLLLQRGKPAYLGSATEAISEYERLLHSVEIRSDSNGDDESETPVGPVLISNVHLSTTTGQTIEQARFDDVLNVNIDYSASLPVANPVVKVRIIRADGVVCALASSLYKPDLRLELASSGRITVTFQPLQLVTGTYVIETRIADSSDHILLASSRSKPIFVSSLGFAQELDRGVFVPNVLWEQGYHQQ